MAGDALSNLPLRAVRLRDYRYPGEVWSLLLTSGALISVFAVATLFFPNTWATTAKAIGLTLAGLAVFVLSVKLQQRAAVGTLVRVSPRQFFELHEIALTAAERLACQPVPVYVKRASEMNIYTLGLWQQPLIVLTSSLVDQMPNDALQFFIGRELGHIHAGHTWLRTLLKPLGADVPVIGKLLNSVIFGDWMNRTEFTADRAGYLACRSLTTAISTMLKFGVGIRLYDKLDIREFLDQINEVHDVRGHLTEIVAEQPYLVQRVRSLVSFALAPETQEIIPQKRGRTDILKDLPTAFLNEARLRTEDSLTNNSAGNPAGTGKRTTLPDEMPALTAHEFITQPELEPAVIDENAFADGLLLSPTDGAPPYRLRRLRTRIGRSRENDIVLESERVSRFHAEIVREAEGFRVLDLASRNGIWRNGTKVDESAPLHSGDVLRLGKHEFTFTDQPNASDDQFGVPTRRNSDDTITS